MPKKLPRAFSCIILACMYHPPGANSAEMRDHVINGVDSMVRKHPDCGVLLTGDFNQLNDKFLKTHYRYAQLVKVPTRGQSTLDKIWTNVSPVYDTPITLSKLGSSDHNMVLLRPTHGHSLVKGSTVRVTIRCMSSENRALVSNNDAEMQGLANNLCEGNIEVLANRINEFLVSVSSNLPRLTNDLAVFDVQDEIPAEYVISVMTTENALQHIKVNKAVGPDNVPAWVLRDNASTLAAPLTALFNTSLRDGVIPALWKTAHVIPLPKKQPPRSIEKDIRPISLTPIVSKIFESIVMKWVDHILEDKIDDKQFGGGIGTSTTDALVEMIHHWCEATDRYGTYVRIVLLDFAKAFDLINHEKLLVKLQANDVPPHILRWMASFLLNRTQQVKIGKNVSSVGYPKGGVPQGTVSGPRNFIMFINDLTTTAPIYKYVDDSTIFEVCKEGDTSQIQESVDIVDIWTSQNDMRLNSEKCKEMIIDFSRNYSLTSGIQSVTIGEKVLERVEHAKMLVVTISNNLTWRKHVDNIVSKAGKRVYMLYQLKRAGISQNDLVKIYVSIIRPVLEYACPVWSTSLLKYVSDAIEMIQKRVLRSIHPGLH